jgi:two-component system, LuxR family, sensor kinase FixL
MGEGRELHAIRKDGSRVPVEIALNPIRSDKGLFIIASIADISERKRLQRDTEIQRDELAHLSRVALLAELSGSLAHELNQPLTAILSNAQAAIRFMAHEPPDLAEVSQSLVDIVENDKRAGEVIRRLRAMLRKDRAEYRSLDINEVVQDVLRIIRSDLLNRNVVTVTDFAKNLPAVEGDRVQLQQVMLNLIMNGTDAMADVVDGRELQIRTQLVSDGGVEVLVSDIGSGIPPENLDRIFLPFVSSKNDGMGLGLAVCTSIIQVHHGKLWATNNATRGATSHIYLPAFSNIMNR